MLHELMNDIPDTIKEHEHQHLENMSNVFCDYFEHLLDDCCGRLDIEFGIQLGSKREKINKQAYTRLLKSLQNNKTTIKADYLKGVKALFFPNKTQQQQARSFNISAASLVAEDSVKEDYAITMMTKTANNLYSDELETLNKKLAQLQGKRIISNDEIPVCPANLITVLVKVIKSLNLAADYRITLYQTFDKKVITQLASIYKILAEDTGTAVNTQIKTKKQPPAISSNINNESSKNQQDFKVLQTKLSNWRLANNTSAYALIPRSGSHALEQDEIVNTLGIIHQLNDYDSPDASTYKPIKWRVIEKFNESRQKNKKKHLAPADEDTLDIISLLFKAIKDDDLINEELKTSFLKLQFPLTELALSDYAFLGDSIGTGRKLLDHLYDAAQFLNGGDKSFYTIKETLDKLINSICTDSHCGMDETKILVDKFSVTMQKNRQCSKIFQKRAIDLINNKEAVELSKKIIDQKINYYIQDREVPTFITDFLFNTWKDLLLLVYLNKDSHPRSWDKSLNITQHLILSVTPTKDKVLRKEIVNSLPTLFKGLQSGLKRISIEQTLQVQFFKDLGNYHDELWTNKKFNFSSLSKKQSTQAIEEPKKPKTPVSMKDPNYFQAKTLQLKQWIHIKTNTDTRWGQLVWLNSETEQYLFVDKNGNKFLESSMPDLVKLFKEGQTKVTTAQNLPFTQRILNSL